MFKVYFVMVTFIFWAESQIPQRVPNLYVFILKIKILQLFPD